MTQYKGDDLVLYAYGDLEPIGCEDSFILTVTASEIITTTKGSGRATNREYGSYDWTIQCTGVITLNEPNKTSSLYFNDNIIKGKKIAVKATIGDEFYFGIGIITSSANTGTSGEFAKFDATISADGPLLSSTNVKNTENEPELFEFTLNVNNQIIEVAIGNVNLLMIFINDNYIDPSNYTYTTDIIGIGIITFTTYYTGLAKIYYVP